MNITFTRCNCNYEMRKGSCSEKEYLRIFDPITMSTDVIILCKKWKVNGNNVVCACEDGYNAD
jgi:hypothetical protein